MSADASDFREPHLRKADFLGAFGVVRDGERILFVQNERVIDGRSQRVWDLPGGQVEPGERLHETLARELHEEVGIELAGGETLLFVQEGERRIRGVRDYAWRSFFFEVSAYRGAPRACSEVLDAAWFTTAELPGLLGAPYHDSFLAWLRDGGVWFASTWVD